MLADSGIGSLKRTRDGGDDMDGQGLERTEGYGGRKALVTARRGRGTLAGAGGALGTSGVRVERRRAGTGGGGRCGSRAGLIGRQRPPPSACCRPVQAAVRPAAGKWAGARLRGHAGCACSNRRVGLGPASKGPLADAVNQRPLSIPSLLAGGCRQPRQGARAGRGSG
jgi:hypothetical protein